MAKLKAIIKNETPVVSVPSAYRVGVVTVVVIPKISNGSVFLVPTDNKERATSSKLSVKPKSPTPTTLGQIIGIITKRKI